jgi:hypothetical protein
MHHPQEDQMINLVLAGAFLISFQIFAQSVSVVDAPIDHLFIPDGFDNNDNVELIVTGKYPNPCFTRNKVDVDVQGDIIKIHVTSLSKELPHSQFCEDLKISFHENITVGNLPAGDYKILINQGSEYEINDKIKINLSTSTNVDDHFYAQVEYIQLGFTGGLSGEALLMGKAVSPCLEIDHVEYLSNNKDTFSILPIMKKISGHCPDKKRSIEIPIKFDLKRMNSKIVMIFVRSIDGKSVYTFIDRENKSK